MSRPNADQYQRAIDLLDDDQFWDRYVDQLEPGEATDVEDNVTVLPLAPPKRTRRATTFQRAVLAAAAGISIVAGFAFLTSEREPEPLVVSSETRPTATAEAVVVAPATPEPEATPVAPTPTPESAEPTPTPNPEPTPPQESSSSSTASEPEADADTPEDPAATPAADESGLGDASDPGTEEEANADSGGAPAFAIDPDSPLGQVLAEINGLRRAEGLADLRWSGALSNVAHEQAWTLSDYQDNNLARTRGFGIDPDRLDEFEEVRQSVWTNATVLGGINIADELPIGWDMWQEHASRGPVVDAVRSDRARSLHVDAFTHIGIAFAAGKYTDTTVLVYANYPDQGPTEPATLVRTDGPCRFRNPSPQGPIQIEPDTAFVIGTPDQPLSYVELRICPWGVSDNPWRFDTDSRYRVSVLRRSDEAVMGEFNCFAWHTCAATVALDGAGPFDLVLSPLSTEDVKIRTRQIQADFYGTDGERYSLVIGNAYGGLTSEVSRARARLDGLDGGWLLEADG